MDSDIQLAIMEKARQVFESEHTFLSFPVTVLSFPASALSFTDEPDDPKADAFQLAEFSRLVNQIPTGVSWGGGEEIYLWDVYDDVMARARVASVDRTEEEEHDYQAALDFLYDEAPDGLRVPSAELSKYQEFNDASIVLRERFGAAKVDAELSEDPEKRRQWDEVELPEWRSQIRALEDEWRESGFKDRVEQARHIESSLGARSPSSTWAEWRSMFDILLDVKTDPHSNRFVETRFAPVNALSDGNWLRFTVSREVAKKLIEEAPPELRNRLEGQASSLDDIESLSFEYSTAKVDRYWFEPSLFKARFFKYPELISDGERADEGVCPAYVAAIVFARNVEVESRTPAGVGDAKPVAVPTLLSFDVVKRRKLSSIPGAMVRRKAIRAIKMPAADVAPGAVTARRLRRATTQVIAQPAVAQPMPTQPAVHATRLHKVTRLNLALRPLHSVAAQPPRPETPPPPPPPATTSEPEIFILAMICRRVPRCPDPDPTLNWKF